MLSILLIFIIGAIYGVLSAMYDLPLWGLYVIVGIWGTITIGNVVYTLYKSQNLAKIRKLITKYKKDPVYKYMLLHEQNAPTYEKIAVLEQVLAKYKQPKYQATYGVHLALAKDDFEEAKHYIRPLIGTDLGDYTNDVIHIISGDSYTQKRTYKKQWMNDSVKAHLAFMQKDLHQFDEYVQKSLANTGGVQYFGNYYSFQQMREKLA